jgi:hypothetical protein
MSTLVADEFAGRQDGNHLIGFPSNNTLYVPGHVIQTVWTKMDNHATYNSYNDNNSRDITGLNTTITLKRANSLVYCQWWVFYECHHDITFQAKRSGTVIGYNTEAGNVRWSGIGVSEYTHSHDLSSTPDYLHMSWVDQPGNVGPHVYSIGSRSSTGTNYDIRINRAWSSFTDGNEGGVSWCILQEIAQ